MAVNQQKIDEIRYMRRQNLEEEAKMVGNYMRDLIRQYGVDVNYYKMKIPYMDIFKGILDDNAMIMQAYGEDPNPNYSLSSDMISYMEVENDIFQMNKFGVLPNQDVNFYFDSKDFACALAWCLGRLKEYPIKEQEFMIEVPEIISDSYQYDYDRDGTVSSEEKVYLSAYEWPYRVGYGMPQFYTSDILSGRFSVEIPPYEMLSGELSDVSREYTVLCRPYEHGDLDISFPVNDTIYQSFNHTIGTKDYVDQMLFITYKIRRIYTMFGPKFILVGKLHGSILFHDLNKVGKYLEQIHPEVGDIITIDFPDGKNRQQYEITDCYDKNLGNDGINPLLHKYVWKCKARRYINSGEDFPEENEANERWEEKIDFLDNNHEEVVKKIAKYDEENTDAIYGGYERNEPNHDKERVDKEDFERMEFIDDGQYIEIFRFYDTSRLLTDGYELFYVDSKNFGYQITLVQDQITCKENLVASGLQYIKSTDDALFFVNFEGKIQKICEDEDITKGEIQNCLNTLVDATYAQEDNNEEGDHYFKFNGSNTVLMSMNDSLYCRFGNKNHKMVRLTVKNWCK